MLQNYPINSTTLGLDLDGIWSHKPRLTEVKFLDYNDNIIYDP